MQADIIHCREQHHVIITHVTQSLQARPTSDHSAQTRIIVTSIQRKLPTVPQPSPLREIKMISSAAARTTTTLVARRGFHATRARLSSPYHYPEGPYSNLPFDPRKKGFGFKMFIYVATGFLAPFGIAAWQLNKPKA